MDARKHSHATSACLPIRRARGFDPWHIRLQTACTALWHRVSPLMPRIKGTPKQKGAPLPTTFTSINTTTTSATAVTSSSCDTYSTVTHPLHAFALISKVMETSNFPIFSALDSNTDQLLSPIGYENSGSLPSSLFFLPERVASQPMRDRDREVVTCSVCQKSMRLGSLREHMDRHENSGKFEQKVHLNEHIRSHSGERPFVCRLCGFSLASKSLLNRHLRTHGVKNGANDAPVMWLRTDAPKSQVLAAAGAVGRSIDAERRIKGGLEVEEEDPGTLHITALNAMATVAALGRKHLCPECPAGFPTIQALRSHRVTTHGLVVEHVCETCRATFSSKKALKMHLRTKHPQICPLCEQVMPQRRRWVLEVHIRENHPGVSADSVIGPSPLVVAVASSDAKREGLRRAKQAPKRCRTTRVNSPNDAAAVNAPTEDSAKLTRGNLSECASEEKHCEGSLMITLDHFDTERNDEDGHEAPSTFFKLHFEPISKHVDKSMPIPQVCNGCNNESG
ncbi:Zinc finger protein [Echinococcus granulosus]|nr:Zinc finger protein [Echinococcus granulosus]